MAESKRRSRSSSNSKGNTGCLLWLVAICIVFVLIFLNIGRIRETLKNTKFMEVVSTKGGQGTPTNPSAPVSPAPKVAEEPVRKKEPKPSASEPAITVEPQSKPSAAIPAAPAETQPAEKRPAEIQPAKPTVDLHTTTPGTEKPAPAKVRAATLYFVHIDGDGVMARQDVKRSIPATDSPLTDAIESLLKGPGEEELRKELITLIPQGTKLLSAQVRGTTAYLNFSESFMYNSYGIEGYAGQLKQVIWTATAFPTVQDVQILIEGERRDFLGGEGVYIGRPLSRNSF
jgi:germination protein M